MHTIKLLTCSVLCIILLQARAQDTTKVNVFRKNIVEVREDIGKTEVSLLNNKINIKDDNFNDTTTIRIGRKNIEIVEGDHRTRVNVTRSDDWDDPDWDWRPHKRFNGHWSGIELGFNSLQDKDYSMYPESEKGFMDLDQPKSLEVNINFIEYNIVLKDDRLGLVTGMGYSMNNYRLDNDLTLEKKDDRLIHPVPPEGGKASKSKLLVSYLTVPFMLELQLPVNGHSNSFFIAGGLLGGINLGSHTKVKYDHNKSKDRGNFNINPFKGAAIIRAGLKNISLYATYSMTSLFKDDKGPEMHPFSVGISLINF